MSLASLATLVANMLEEQSPGNELGAILKNKAEKILVKVFQACPNMQCPFHTVSHIYQK